MPTNSTNPAVGDSRNEHLAHLGELNHALANVMTSLLCIAQIVELDGRVITDEDFDWLVAETARGADLVTQARIEIAHLNRT